ncbi:MAG TPA: DUF177 domain-containing protein [Terriglobales bacterium]
MFISIQELELRKIEFSEEIRPGVIDFGSDLVQTNALKTSGRAELVAEHRGGKEVVEDIRVVGHFAVGSEVPCARCLDPVPGNFSGDFDLLYRPLGIDARKEEASISEAETEIGYYTGDGVILEDVLKEQILLVLPVKAICRESCKGFCPHCGKNLNSEQCSCAGDTADARWSALADIRSKLKN